MSLEHQEEQLRRRYEGERSRETKEGEPDAELKAATTLERADYLVKEVKQSKKQMQNILVHMQHVLATIRQLLIQLQLPEDDHPASVEQDKKRIEQLQKKIATYKNELVKMKGDLIAEYSRTLQEQDPHASVEEIEKKAVDAVEEMIRGVEKD